MRDLPHGSSTGATLTLSADRGNDDTKAVHASDEEMFEDLQKQEPDIIIFSRDTPEALMDRAGNICLKHRNTPNKEKPWILAGPEMGLALEQLYRAGFVVCTASYGQKDREKRASETGGGPGRPTLASRQPMQSGTRARRLNLQRPLRNPAAALLFRAYIGTIRGLWNSQ